MESERGIEANSKKEKIKAILDMQPLKTIKEVKRLNGRITALGRFMSCFARRCLPFYRALKARKQFQWGEDCQKAFEELKVFLSTPPLLDIPREEEILYLHLLVIAKTLSSVLA